MGCRPRTPPAPPLRDPQPPNGPPCLLRPPHQPVLCSAARAIFRKHKPDPIAQLLIPTNGFPSRLELMPDFLLRPPDPLPPDSHSCSLKPPGLLSGLLAPPASRPWHLLVPGSGTAPPHPTSRTSCDRPRLPTEISARMSAAQPGLCRPTSLKPSAHPLPPS